jgi:uncharacterized protein YndB with AHSA1/START domain
MAEPSPFKATAEIEIAATPEAVFDAWLDPSLAARFFAAGETVVRAIAIDPREGGAFRLVMGDESETFEHQGRYVVIDRPRRLVLTWISSGTDHRLSLVEITFTPTAAGVKVRVEHEGIPDAERAGRHQRGWETILIKLAHLFAEGARS